MGGKVYRTGQNSRQMTRKNVRSSRRNRGQNCEKEKGCDTDKNKQETKYVYLFGNHTGITQHYHWVGFTPCSDRTSYRSVKSGCLVFPRFEIREVEGVGDG